MTVEIAAVGGWGEVGRNMTAVKIDNEAVIFDMGLHLPNYIKLTEEEIGEFRKLTEASLKRAEAVPQDTKIKDWRDEVIAIIITHAHLDHIGAVPHLAAKYNAPIICTPFSAQILRTICQDEKIDLQNKIIELKPGQTIPLSKNLKLEFCHITHSTPQTIIATLHTPHGTIMYGNDYKLDSHPTMGSPVNYDHLKKLGEKGVLALIQDCLYSTAPRKTPSEQVAKDMLRDVLIDIDSKGKGIIVTTFASHIARLKTIAEYGKMLGRKTIIMGRSMAKYSYAAKDSGLIDLSKQAQILKYARQIRRKLKEVQNKKEKYLLVVSGHQGEPKSTLSKMADGVYKWKFANDHVIFSSQIIPAEINIQQRAILDKKLTKQGARLFKDIHVSGHNSKEDLREIIKILKPKYLLPTHGEPEKTDAFKKMAKEEGYTDKTIHILTNGQRITL
ncbi:RNase J family beta-CASP ribonuclease [Candidatus Woesearchaeota archaeon]|nr:RNase J family beta-CASP ribonuclease [Candidatus Woesearchaeota archaeon]MBW3016587.1 RNase J family beta-CASP ribonuclease [Candidatus Woesearchaeota archaeon]